MPRPRRSAAAYRARLDPVLDHIRAHPADTHTIDELARIACFSPFHFHRVFTAVIGETVGAFVRRARMERAVALMKAAPDRPLGRIAAQCGFASQSDLTRAFRAFYGVPPGRWDRRSPLVENRKHRQADDPCRRYTDDELAHDHEAGTFTVRIEERPAVRVAFLRVTDSYDVRKTLDGYARFVAWLRSRGGGQMPPGTMIGVSHDDPDVTPAGLCRYDFCFAFSDVRRATNGGRPTAEDVTRATGDGPGGRHTEAPSVPWQAASSADEEIGVRELAACRVAAVHVAGEVGLLSRAWDYLYQWWLPRSRWQPANLPAMEIYRRTPEEVGWEWFDLDCCVPVEPF